MCGIAGIYAYGEDAPPVDREELLRIREHMVRRGPDGAGLWMSPDGRLGLAHRRLAIIDLSEGGAQPKVSADGRYVVTFNGEIYNYRELRRELEGRGHIFRSQSDTEVLLHLYADRGERMVDALRGMFAFGIWDTVERTLFLARDPFGIKPLYYADDGRTFRFASQVKALVAGNAIELSPDAAGFVGYFLLGSVPEPYTLYREIASLAAGSTLTIAKGCAGRLQPFFDIRQTLLGAEQVRTRPDPAVFGELVRNSVHAHLVADVPVGVFLSAGVDSGSIAAITAESGTTDVRAITLGFAEFQGTSSDEVPIAREVARSFGLPHHCERVTREDFESECSTIFGSMDQPSIDGVNTYFVSRAAARAGLKVALSGLGGDELLGTYPSYRQVPRLESALGWTRKYRRAGTITRRLSQAWIGRFTSPKYASLLEYGGTIGGGYLLRRGLFLPWEIADVLDEGMVREGIERLDLVSKLDASADGLRKPRTRIASLEMSWYMRNQLLRDADWAGMANSVEIRTPLVDSRLFVGVSPSMASRRPPTKDDLAAASARRLAPEVLHRPKSGFGTPVQQWVRSADASSERGLREWSRRVLREQGALVRTPVQRSGASEWDGPAYRPARSRVRAAQAELAKVAYGLANGALSLTAKALWPRTRPSNVRRIVVFRTGHIGDTVCALPAIRSVRIAYPDATLDILTSTGNVKGPGAAQVLQGIDWIDEVVSYGAGEIATFRGRLDLARRLRQRQYDLWINVSANLSSVGREFRDMAFARLVGPRWARGWTVATISIAAQAQSEYLQFDGEVERCCEIVLRAGIPRAPVEFGLPSSREARTRVDALLCRRSERPLVAIAPGAKRSTNVWPAERHLEVGRELARGGADIVLVGGTSDRDTCQRIADGIGTMALSLAGRLSIAESCEVLRRCRLAICVDSGVQHLASAVGTPCISLFSFWQMRGKWRPWGGSNVVLQKWVPCHTCLLSECPRENRCMTEIPAAEVVAHARSLLWPAVPAWRHAA